MRFLLCIPFVVTQACNNTIQCEKHFLPQGFLGRVTIYFDQKDGQNQVDKEGCIKYRISGNGECRSSYPLIEGTEIPRQTVKYFERISDDSTNELFEFFEHEYLRGTLRNGGKKYIYFVSSGYSRPNFTIQYDVDFGRNYKKHLFNN